MRFEYRVIPAPTKGIKARGLKTGEARFAHALEELMNAMAAEGWEFQRAETLPSTERTGLTSTTTSWRNLLVFKRLKETAQVASTAADQMPASLGAATTAPPEHSTESVSAGPDGDPLPGKTQATTGSTPVADDLSKPVKDV